MTFEAADAGLSAPTSFPLYSGSGTGLGEPLSPAAALKRGIDIGFALIALALVGILVLLLLPANRVLNPGPLFFRQRRMGRDGALFRLWKFRTMVPADCELRAPDAPLEEDRVTMLGRFLRRTRIDELPNAVNVLTGDMSLVGPRPDAYDHAIEYIKTIRHYHHRLRVRPGITGIAQVRGGYADTKAAIRRKARLDRLYVERASGLLDLYIMARTFTVVFTGFGAK